MVGHIECMRLIERVFMSKGIGTNANLIFQDDTTIIYEYANYNLNEEDLKDNNHIYDGTITIQRSCFLEPKIHSKLKKKRNGKKKLITKKIIVNVDYPKMLKNGSIVVKNCSQCYNTTNDEKNVDIMVCHILYYLFLKYQEQGKIPRNISYNV